MAHFAKLGLNNVVTEVIVIDNIKTMTPGGIEREDIGVEYLTGLYGHETWRKCSYNSHGGVRYDSENNPTDQPAFRANYPGPGWIYDSELDIFHQPQPYASWTLNTTTGYWEPPIEQPIETEEEFNANQRYRWNEDAYQADNSTGWILSLKEMGPTD